MEFLAVEFNSFFIYQVLCRPTGGGPRLDRRARIQFRRVNFGVFSTSRFVPSALSSGFLATFPLLCFTLHLLFANFFILLTYFSSTCPVLCFTFSYVFITFFCTSSFFPLFFAKLKYIFKNQKFKKFLLALAVHREHFLVTMFKKRNSYR